MRVINVIEVDGGAIKHVESFGVFEEQLSDEVSNTAEKHFLAKIKENNEGIDLDDEEEEEALDNGYWETEHNKYYEITIVWSDI